MTTTQRGASIAALAARMAQLEASYLRRLDEVEAAHRHTVAELQADNAALRARLGALEHERAGARGRAAGGPPRPGRTSRRRVLGLAAQVAAAGVAAGVLADRVGGGTAHARGARAAGASNTFTASGSGNWAVEASGTSAADGLHGDSDTGIGVQGTSTSGDGVSGTTGGISSVGIRGTNTGNGVGVLGDGGSIGIGVKGQTSGSGTAVAGYTHTGTAVYGQSDSGYGVQGFTNSGVGGVGVLGGNGLGTAVLGQGTNGAGTGVGTGVEGHSNLGIGVHGHSDSGMGGSFAGGNNQIGAQGSANGSAATGVSGQSDHGYGVVGTSGTGVDLAAQGTGRFLQTNTLGHAGPPTAGDGTFAAGEQIRDSNWALWICTAAGTPGTWRQVVAVPSTPAATLQLSNTGAGHVGIEGDGSSGAVGVIGTSDTAAGVNGQSNSSYGVFGASAHAVDIIAGGTGRIQQVSTLAHAGPPTGPDGTFAAGEQIRDSNYALWICTGGGTPGTWRQVAAVAPGYAGGALNFLPTPIRLLDTRMGAPVGNTLTNAPIAYHGTLSFAAAGVTYQSQTIPTGAIAVFGLLTVALAAGVNPGDGSSMIAYAAGATRPAAVNVVYNPQDLHGAYTSDFTMVQTGASGQVSLYSQPITLGVAVDAIFDCFGFLL